MRELGLPMGTRTKLIGSLIAKKCKELGAPEEQAEACGQIIEKIFIKEDKRAKTKKKDQEAETIAAGDDDNDTLLFRSPGEVEIIANAFKENGFSSEGVITGKDQKKQAAELVKLIGNPEQAVNAVDIALFGRMVAKAADMNVEAAASFAHAISTHKVSNEWSFSRQMTCRPPCATA
ncbi:type I-E CRISPR-associated protein Cas7/Cse4/CasC [Azotobacter chroococcum]|uniref:type I-E CRISPR-associated protein Cas7/Cse4/CasC n=1 Tax=Azotobacter chroococcum TaxID=353 RepID=UPI001B8B95D5